MSIPPSCSFLQAVLSLLFIATFTRAQSSEDGQGSGSGSSGENSADSGAAGPQTSGFTMSKSGFIALIVVVVVVAVIGSK